MSYQVVTVGHFCFLLGYCIFSVICERARGCPNHVSSFRMSQIRFRVKSQRTGRHVWFTAKTMRQSKDWWVLNQTSFHTQTAHAVAFQSLTQSRKALVSSDGEKQTSNSPNGHADKRQVRRAHRERKYGFIIIIIIIMYSFER